MAIAPEFSSGTWFNTLHPLSLAELRGQYVLLDFWTGCCMNCIHVTAELRPFEAKYSGVVTVIGVHSPKFDHEQADAAVLAAVQRNEIGHPVFNDRDMQVWRGYGAQAWPTLVLIDPDGHVIARAAGEGQVAMLDDLIAERLSEGPVFLESQVHAEAVESVLSNFRYPSRAIALPSGDWLVADTGHHQLVHMGSNAVVRRWGTGVRGLLNGEACNAQFAEPSGLALVPDEFGFDLVVADTANDVLRGVRLSEGLVVDTISLQTSSSTIQVGASSFRQRISPTDVVWWPAINSIVVAAAGIHQLLQVDLRTRSVSVLAGTSAEGLMDGPAHEGMLAQPSGLAADAERLWFVDAETSSLRYITASDRVLHTVIGAGLFEFGHVDGQADGARFQHPLGLALLDDNSLVIADTYNGAIRRYDVNTNAVSTLIQGLREPVDILPLAGQLFVVESAAHKIEIGSVDADIVFGTGLSTTRPITELAPGRVELRVHFRPGPGRKLDERYGPGTRVVVGDSPLLFDGAGESSILVRELVLADSGNGVLSVAAQAASCDEGVSTHPACYLARQDWSVPVQITSGGQSILDLVLLQ